ncbi:hypothetical protein [Paenibacillus sp. M-152]|uniref:hypothetical protein n=1 Tax=Paenibacillus sp. M-152 TaxID=2487928 RepID=UPI000F6F05CA|nr:hypothetical protein [Paenibacillus sp. M-152]AZH32038.1 hypothetical protein EGM68_18285 [Paenibacillus sp. M-152]
MQKLWQKGKALSLPIVVSASLISGTLLVNNIPTVNAAVTKELLQLSGQTTYYGEVENGQPNGRGTIKWSEYKQYSGDFVNGKRSGTGKYMNQYTDADGQHHKIVYNGTWSNDTMSGKGTQTEKVTQSDGTIRSNQIQVGTFQDNGLQNGYQVIHAVADPDYSFTYKNGKEVLNILHSNQDLVQRWQQGELFSVNYKNGSVQKEYSMFPEEVATKERQRQAAIKYLKGITAKVTPHLQQFEKLSKQVPLK